MSRELVSLALLACIAASARAQRTQLELRPKVGDTLRMRLDQVTEMSGTRKGATSKKVVTTLHMFSRAIVESSSADATLILAITDSVDVSTSDEHARSLTAEAHRQLEGRQMRLQLSPDGTVSLPQQTADVPKEVSDLVSVMPASFPREAIAVGDTWVREMPIPPGARLGLPIGGVVYARFRLDSTTRGGDAAHISMRGTFHQPAQTDTTKGTLSGSVNGTMTVNRRRGWLSESRFLVQMLTIIAGHDATQTSPTQVRTKITQHMRVFDKR